VITVWVIEKDIKVIYEDTHSSPNPESDVNPICWIKWQHPLFLDFRESVLA
jgi:hypothetical protein